MLYLIQTLVSAVTSVQSASYFHIRNFARIRQFLPRSAAITFLNALVGSRIDYCNSRLNSVSANDFQGLQHIQNSLARIVCKKSRFCHTTPLLKEVLNLPDKYRITFKQCLMVYKTIATGIPAYFSELIIPYVCHVNTRRSKSSKHLLKTADFKRSKHKSTQNFDFAFSVFGPRLWNSLPFNIRGSETVSSFRRSLKTHLFDLAFPPHP